MVPSSLYIDTSTNTLPLYWLQNYDKYREFLQRYSSELAATRQRGDGQSVEIIGVTDFALVEQTIKALDSTSLTTNGLTDTVDSTTYPDHAVLSFTNGLGYDAYLTQLTIHGKPIKRYRGTLIHDSLRRDDDIRKNGEKTFELENEYIIDATQVTNLADFHFKDKGKKKHRYALTLKGFRPWYSPGDWYSLAYGAAGKNEYVNSTVECYDVQCERTAGSIGTTTLLLREVEENWQKTTFYTARARSAGSPKRRNQQSNTVIVASSTFSGTYDYRCDGTADDVQIKEAIDYVYYTFGGGVVYLTPGSFKCSGTMNLRSNITIIGSGSATVIDWTSTSNGLYFDINDSSIVCGLRDFKITQSAARSDVICIFAEFAKYVDIQNIEISNITVSGTLYAIEVNYTDATVRIENCYIHDLETTTTSTGYALKGITGGIGVYKNRITDFTSALNDDVAFDRCRSCSNNSSANVANKYNRGTIYSYSDLAGTAGYECADTPNGGYNS